MLVKILSTVADIFMLYYMLIGMQIFVAQIYLLFLVILSHS